MLVGRDAECARIDALLGAARGRRSAALVVRGEAGIGKTALLDYAVERSGGFRVLRALGAESEAELPFAGVQQLLHPILDALAAVPPGQARAFKTALGVETGPAPERLIVSVATLTLLAAAAEEEPLLCVIDDAHWLDQASAETLTFAARRQYAEQVVMLFAAREPEKAVFVADGLENLTLLGLPAADARTLLEATEPGLSDQTADRIVALTHGNPLALLEVPRALSEEHRAGRAPIEGPLPVGPGVERLFLERVKALKEDAQRALLLVAAGDPGDPDALFDALAAGVDQESVRAAEEAGLLRPGRLEFCHPLARSAVYQGARPGERRAAHAALAKVTTAPDRRAWHLAAAADRPDDLVAEALVGAAAAARRRGGVAAEARALQQAARLTQDRELRARRLLEAAFATEAAGSPELAETLLADAAELTNDPDLRAQAAARRSYLLADRGEFDRAHALSVDEAGRAPPERAAHLLSLGALFALTHSLSIPAALETARHAWELAGTHADLDLHLRENLCRTLILAGDTDEAVVLARSSISRLGAPDELAVNFGTDLLYLEDYARAREVLERAVARMREADAFGFLPYALDQLAKLETRAGALTRAYALELECLQMVEPFGSHVALAASLAWLGTVEAMLGRAESRAHAEAALRIAEARRDLYNVVRARGALGLEALARGDVGEAADWLEPAVTATASGGVANPNFFRLDADLIEALIRLGRPEHAEPHLARLEQQAEATAGAWARAAAARCRAFLSPVSDIVDRFEAALELHEHEPSPFERARTELCYGERLRREGQRRGARNQLERALEGFERIGAEPWAERARAELRASGARLQRRDPTDAERLTPQELQIALLVSEGLTNRDVAARLFLSPKTVEFHLTRIYRKLDLHSRAELIRRIVSGIERTEADPTHAP
jgi:DNA-binding CsgD family transcriptional regulator